MEHIDKDTFKQIFRDHWEALRQASLGTKVSGSSNAQAVHLRSIVGQKGSIQGAKKTFGIE